MIQDVEKKPIGLMDKTILVVIPYLAKGAQGNELELAVAGWEKFFKEEHQIVVVGDWHSVVDRGDVLFIDCPQIKQVKDEYQYLPHLDHVNKFRAVRKKFPSGKGFIYTCDDIYPTADFTIDDVLRLKRPHEHFEITDFDWRREGGWLTDLGKTRDLCKREGLSTNNWVCHLPVYYDWEALLRIYDTYDCDHESYIVENIYFNMRSLQANYVPDDDILYHDEVRTAHPGIRPLGSVKWVSNANCGWSQELEDMIRRHYGMEKL